MVELLLPGKLHLFEPLLLHDHQIKFFEFLALGFVHEGEVCLVGWFATGGSDNLALSFFVDNMPHNRILVERYALLKTRLQFFVNRAEDQNFVGYPGPRPARAFCAAKQTLIPSLP